MFNTLTRSHRFDYPFQVSGRLFLFIIFAYLVPVSCHMKTDLVRNKIASSSPDEMDKPPNFLIILADDLGYGDLGCYNHPYIQTPNLDALAKEGMQLTDCYASAPMCSPSRAGLLTGKVPYRTGIYDWIAPDSSMHLPPQEVTIANLLKDAGYQTGHFGKWHLNGKMNSIEQTQPFDHGFDYWFSTQYSAKHLNPEGFFRNGYPLKPKGYSSQIVATKAVDWLKNKWDRRKPFFQFVCFHEPHEPIMSPPDLIEKYQEHGKKAEYYANVTNMDRAVGQIMDALKEGGVDENTVVIFTSDNGPAQYTPRGYFNKSHGSAGPLRGYKRHQFEGGIRVPGIIRWPNHVEAGTKENTPISNVDFLPTISQLARVKLPKDIALDGADFSPLFTGQPMKRVIPLQWHFYDPWGGPQSLIREGDWILGADWDVGDFHKSGRFDPVTEIPIIRASQLSDYQLYNIQEDIHQDHNIASEYPEKLEELTDKLQALHQNVVQKTPFPSPNNSAKKKPNILLIVSEDNGPDLGCYGVKEVKSPNIDRLAEQGALFNRAYVTYSVCSPSRSTIYTGLYPHQNGQIGLATHRFSMYGDMIKTLPVLLKEGGYRTGCLGKIHVNPESAIPFDFHPIKGSNFAKTKLPEYAKEAASFIRSSEEPFFLMVNFPDAHFPLQRQVEGMPAFPIDGESLLGSIPFAGADSERLQTFTANYYNSMMRLDESVGILLDSLKATGKDQETLIIYLGDHGAQFSRGKCSNYEAGLRVPFIIHWPEKVKGGQKREELISSIDLLPSILDAAELQIPGFLPGKSLLPLINEKQENWDREYIYADGAGSTALLYYPRRSVRDDQYKLIVNLLHERENPKFRFYADQHNQHFAAGTMEAEIAAASTVVQNAYETWKNPPLYELYDLKNDSLEWHNLAGDPKHRKVLERLKKALEYWQIETDDPFRHPEILSRFTAEIDTINLKYPNHTYTKVPEFRWKYHAYFR